MHHGPHVEVRRQFLEIGSLLPPYGLQKSNSDHQAHEQMKAFSTEATSTSPECVFSLSVGHVRQVISH